MAPLTEGDRFHGVRSSYGGVEQRRVRLHSALRQPQAQRTVDKQGRKRREQDVQACKTLGRTACACAADAPQALARLAPDVQTTFLHDSPVYPISHDGKRGRLGPEAQPEQSGDPIAGALASRLTDRQARVDQQSCCILATNERAEGPFSAQPGRNAGCAVSKPRSCWRPPSTSKSLNASWPC
jgi:hypothetical protein